MQHDWKLPWSVAPLDGKYYGTRILDAREKEVLCIWDHASGDFLRPSSRERDRLGPFASDEEFESFWKDYVCDSHYESERDLAMAEMIVLAINQQSPLKEG